MRKDFGSWRTVLLTRLLLLASLLAPCWLVAPITQHTKRNVHVILRSVLRVGVPMAHHERTPTLDSLALARSTEHALRTFCAVNGVSALRCAGLHTTVAWHLVAKARELRNITGAGAGADEVEAARAAVAERFTLLLPGLLNNTWQIIELP